VNPHRKYRILSVLGRGGFGTVYKAEFVGDGGFTKKVALKVLNPDLENVEEVARRFRDEARMLGLIRHRAIVQVDGLVRLSGRWAVIMEFVEGVSLKQIVTADRVPPSAALQIAGELAGALDVAYNAPGPEGGPLRLLHRDIKPANIQITAAGEVKLLDFGIARGDFKSREAATQSLLFGSEGYMSPERLDLMDGPAADVYSLGVVLYEMLTSESFGRSSARESRHRGRVLEAMDVLWKGTGEKHEELVRFVGEMLSYEPEDRPLSREVERRAWELSRKVGDMRMRDWTEGVVPPLAAQLFELPADELSGSVLTESSASAALGRDTEGIPPNAPEPKRTGRPQAADQPVSIAWRAPEEPQVADSESERAAPPPAISEEDATVCEPSAVTPAPPTPKPDFSTSPGAPHSAGGRGRGVKLGIAAVVVLLLVAVVAWWAARGAQRPVEPAVAETPAPQVVNPTAEEVLATLDEIENRAVPEQQPDPVEPAAPVGVASALPGTNAPVAQAKAAPDRPESSAPAAPSSASAGGSVKVTGDAASVHLSAAGARHSPGAVPAGQYTIFADFGAGQEVAAGTAQVSEGGAVTIHCDSMFQRCSAKY